jgi:predicted RNA-binding protein YlxR (DUF448 family)
MKKITDAVRKRVPERTCIACRQVKSKREMVRIVKTMNEGVMVDEKGKQAGRGAYLCKAKKCWHDGLKGNRLEFVLRTKLTQEDRQRLEDYRAKL